MKVRKLFIITSLTLITYILLSANNLPALGASQIEYIKGEVTKVIEFDPSVKNKDNTAAKGDFVTVLLTSGPESGKIITVVNYKSGRSLYDLKIKPGDKIILSVTNDFGIASYHISDFDRIGYVYVLVGVFILVLVVFGGWIGMKSLLALGFSVVVIFKIFIDQVILDNVNLTLLTLLASVVISSVTQVLISGVSKKTLAAVLGTIGGVAVAGALSMLSIYIMHLNGLDSEEAIMLKATKFSYIDFEGILFAGMVFGALGAVMDVSISIASSIQELKLVQPSIDFKKMIKSGMNVGRDIMGTMSNTLILAYSGSSLPLMLMVASQEDASMLKIVNLGMIVTEIVRALTGSIGLICTIPLTAVISAALFSRETQKQETHINIT